jgi:hypothetical protein
MTGANVSDDFRLLSLFPKSNIDKPDWIPTLPRHPPAGGGGSSEDDNRGSYARVRMTKWRVDHSEDDIGANVSDDFRLLSLFRSL